MMVRRSNGRLMGTAAAPYSVELLRRTATMDTLVRYVAARTVVPTRMLGVSAKIELGK